MAEQGSPSPASSDPTEDPEAILARARERAQSHECPFAGELTPGEAYALLEALPNASLVDVRTQPERDFVGYPTLGTHVEWETYPDMAPNPEFPDELREEVGPDPEQVLVFMCRSGKRSARAAEAMTREGYRYCFNLLQGFEGDKDEAGHRGTRAGWKAEGLPWEQR